MEFVVLGLLLLRNMTLYELGKAFEQGVSLFYSSSNGSLQTALGKLLKQGWVRYDALVENGRNKKRYEVTEAGRKAFYEWMHADIPVARLEVTALSKLYFLGLLKKGTPRQEVIRNILHKTEAVERRLSEMDETLHQLEVPEEKQEIMRYQLETLNYGVHAHRFALDWFRDLLKRVEAAESE